MALETPHRLDDLTVAELRRMARERGLKGYSRMKKAELVKALGRAPTSERRDAEDHAPTITSDDHGEGEGADGNRTTADHDEIRAWADERNAVPATEEGPWEGTRPVVLRFRFPHSPSGTLRQIDWPIWFQTFDNRRLRFIYVVPADGSRSDYFQLQGR